MTKKEQLKAPTKELTKKIRFIAPKSQKSNIDSTQVSIIVGLAFKSIAPKHPT